MVEHIKEGIEDNPIMGMTWLENPIEKSELPQISTNLSVVKIRRVTSQNFVSDTNRIGERYIIVTDLGDAWLNWTSVKALRNAWGNNTIDWIGKKVDLEKKRQLVFDKERDVLYFRPA